MATEIIVTDEFKLWFEGLNESEQEAIDRVVGLLQERGVTLEFPFSSGIKGSKVTGMRELRIQHVGHPYRILYAFRPDPPSHSACGRRQDGRQPLVRESNQARR